MQLKPSYSLLMRYSSKKLVNHINEIKDLLKNGIKVIIITDRDMEHFFADSDVFIKNYMLQLFVISQIKKEFTIVDGAVSESENQVLSNDSKKITFFNYQQYKVEHAPPDEHLMVQAGAGTGKTMVMVQRVMFLLEKAKVKPEEIVMITFTREAAQEMFQRLKQELFSRYKATKQPKYLAFIEELKKMRISTIHSFAKSLIQELGSTLGYGMNVNISSFTMERKKIIEDYLNEEYKEEIQNGRVKKEISPLKLHELIKIAVSFWQQMENKGLTRDEIKKLKWGTADQKAKKFNDLFIKLYSKCEDEFQKLKENRNAVILSDLTRQVDMASRNENEFNKISRQIKYLFIDEFQDSDDVQIELFARLQKAFHARIFAVGDIKQSIYRFRGANSTAFDELRKKLDSIPSEYPLTKNYRTSKELLDELHLYFKEWGKHGLLSYKTGDKEKENDRLVGVHSIKDNKKIDIIPEYTFKESDLKITATKYIRSAINDIEEMKKTDAEAKNRNYKLAALVRTRKQAKMLEKWCNEEGIPVDLNIGGTFYISDAVKDFKILAEALLFPNRPSSLSALINSPFFDDQIHWSELAHYDQEQLAELLRKKLDADNNIRLEERLNSLRIKPVFAVLRELITESNVYNNYYNQMLRKYHEMDSPEKEEQAERKTIQYKKNMNHLMELCHQNFNEDFATLYKIYKWIEVNMASNREEDEPEIDEDVDKGTFLRIVTVHSAKGLEYHTVIIPFTGRKYRYERNELILSNDKKKAGWLIKQKGEVIQNNYFGDLTENEDMEIEMEEARLLYVAMTRARERLWILHNKKRRGPNWADLIKMKGGE